ncbi:MAG: hypothetical protein EOR84_26035 [Mesorhizobium sp.]|uniref:hypothetical protein n=1 Tax=Mesorhizobium sp. TaxID=1871066 RepID=UPI000FEA78CB|nr:hypothetical protein [Mesorhizobium sp.]RWM88890.1 MAG: hypothetical protein EOR84_26035 [Mesorhizobium sp.]
MASGGKIDITSAVRVKAPAQRDDRIGAMTTWAKDKVEEMRLCPTEPGKQHTEQRQLDGNRINSDQYHAADRLCQD